MADRYLCLGCYEVYDQFLCPETKRCPKSCCNGKVIELDELMIPIIMTLNHLGYKTEYCCSGHMDSVKFLLYDTFEYGAYIKFDADGWRKLLDHNKLSTLPASWYVDKSSSCCIRNVEPNIDAVRIASKRYQYWLNYMNDLMQWTDTLGEDI